MTYKFRDIVLKLQLISTGDAPKTLHNINIIQGIRDALTGSLLRYAINIIISPETRLGYVLIDVIITCVNYALKLA